MCNKGFLIFWFYIPSSGCDLDSFQLYFPFNTTEKTVACFTLKFCHFEQRLHVSEAIPKGSFTL